MSDVHGKLLDVQSQMVCSCSVTEHTIDTGQAKPIKVHEEGSSRFWRKSILLSAELSVLNIKSVHM